MNKRSTPWLAAALLLAFAAHAPAQVAPKSPAEAASAAPTRPDGRPAPRLLTPAELRESGEPLDETPPAGKAIPQIAVPIGPRPPEPAASAARPTRRPPVADAAARCQAEESDLARARCRDALARERRIPR